MTRKHKLADGKNVVAGATDAYVNLPTGQTYSRVILLLSNIALTEMKNIRVKIGTKTIQTFKDAAELRDYNKRYGRHEDAANGYLHFYFDRPELHSFEDRRVCALGTADVNQLRIVFNLSDPLAAAPADPKVECWAARRENTPLGVFTRITPQTEDYSTVGDHIESDISWSGDLMGIHILGKISDAELELDEAPWWRLSKSMSEQFAAGEFKPRTSIADWFHMDFIDEGELDTALDPSVFDSKHLNITNTATGQVRYLFETLDMLRAA